MTEQDHDERHRARMQHMSITGRGALQVLIDAADTLPN